MNCPVCHSNLRAQQADDIEIDVCPKCFGIWFDAGELGRVAGMLAQDSATETPAVSDVFGKGLRQPDPNMEPEKNCPKCGQSTILFQYAYDSGIFLNRCPVCGGMWADAGEVLQIAKYLKGNPLVDRLGDSLLKYSMQRRKYTLIYSKKISGIIAFVYLAFAFYVHDAAFFINLALYLVIPLACIWFARELGGYTGMTGLARPPITRRSYPPFVAFCGWILLLAPVVFILVSLIRYLVTD